MTGATESQIEFCAQAIGSGIANKNRTLLEMAVGCAAIFVPAHQAVVNRSDLAALLSYANGQMGEDAWDSIAVGLTQRVSALLGE